MLGPSLTGLRLHTKNIAQLWDRSTMACLPFWGVRMLASTSMVGWPPTHQHWGFTRVVEGWWRKKRGGSTAAANPLDSSALTNGIQRRTKGERRVAQDADTNALGFTLAYFFVFVYPHDERRLSDLTNDQDWRRGCIADRWADYFWDLGPGCGPTARVHRAAQIGQVGLVGPLPVEEGKSEKSFSPLVVI